MLGFSKIGQAMSNHSRIVQLSPQLHALLVQVDRLIIVLHAEREDAKGLQDRSQRRCLSRPAGQLQTLRKEFLGCFVMPAIDRQRAKLIKRTGHPKLIVQLPPKRQRLLVQISSAVGVAENLGNDSQVRKRRGDPKLISHLTPEIHCLLVKSDRWLVIALALGQDAGSAERLSPDGRWQIICSGQGSRQPSPALRQVTAHPPEPPQGGGDS